ncbi:MAG: NADH-quinone oxidoreductase subunit L [Pseudomonadota bacterium]
MNDFLWLVPLFPFLGFLILVLSEGNLAKSLVPWVGAGSVGASALLAALIGTGYLGDVSEPLRLTFGNWIAVNDFEVPFGFYLDALSVTMMFVVTGVGFLIHVYSAGFMESDPGYARFFAYMNLFVAAMLVLVLADNLVLLYLGWEGVGLCSYLLIGFWYQVPANGYAARKAFVVTRVGDTAMALGLFLLFTHLNTLDIQTAMARAGAQWESGSTLPVLAAALLLGGAVGKSAQLPLQTWLPDAMAGPTPISALIHAATMVTAGVYLIARTHVLFTLAPSVQFAVGAVGAITLLISGFTALTQTDIKRILAYSTISQIGYMFLALGVGAWSASIFHLMTHAFFKALLFLAAGAVIFCLHHEHNIFNMGGLRKSMPITFWSFMIGSAALAALPLTSGYYSKHDILLAAFDASPVLWAAGCFGALITGIYSFRLVFIAFFGRAHHDVEETIGWRMGAPLILLCTLALFGGMLQVPLDSVFPPRLGATPHDGLDFASVFTAAAPFVGLGIAVLFFLTGTYSAERLASTGWGRWLQQFWFGGWGMDRLYDALLSHPFKTLAAINKNDVVDGCYPAVAVLSRGFHRMTSASQTGSLRRYAAAMGFGAVIAIAIGLLS